MIFNYKETQFLQFPIDCKNRNHFLIKRNVYTVRVLKNTYSIIYSATMYHNDMVFIMLQMVPYVFTLLKFRTSAKCKMKMFSQTQNKMKYFLQRNNLYFVLKHIINRKIKNFEI